MDDKFNCFAELSRQYQIDRDFKISCRYKDGRIVIFTPHGGGIEGGTSELVTEIAGNDLSFYVFEGLLAHANQDLHITSAKFDEPKCVGLLTKFQTAIAIHGCEGHEEMIYVGGKDIALMSTLVDRLKDKGYPIRSAAYPLSGSYYKNICNRTASGRGVQLELSSGFRHLLFENWANRKGREIKTKYFYALTEDIRTVVLE